MKKYFIVAGILLSLFLVASVAYAQLTDWEKQVFYDLLETGYFNPVDLDVLYQEVALRHGTDVETVKSISYKALEQEPTEWERQVFDDLDKRLRKLPQEAPIEDRKKVYQEVAAKYDLRLGELYSIENKCLILAPD